MRVAGLLFGQRDAGSFVQAGLRGMQQAADDFGCRLELHWCDSADVRVRADLLHDIAHTRPDLIVLHGGQGEAPLAREAGRWPEQRFALTQGSFPAPNVTCYVVQLEQPAYLAGALAAWTTQTGVIAHLSGEPVGPGVKGEAAFRAGALKAAPGLIVRSHFCGQQHDAELAHAAVLEHVQHGADIVFTMLGLGRAGAIAACRKAGIWQIGDGIDWCAIEPDIFIASAFADSAWCCHQAIEDAAYGRPEMTQGRHVGLERPEICRLIMRHDIPAPIRARVEALPVPGFE